MQNIISVPLEFEEWLQKRWKCRKVVFHQSQDQGFQWKYLHQHPNSYYVLMPGDRKIDEQQIINVWEALKKQSHNSVFNRSQLTWIPCHINSHEIH